MSLLFPSEGEDTLQEGKGKRLNVGNLPPQWEMWFEVARGRSPSGAMNASEGINRVQAYLDKIIRSLLGHGGHNLPRFVYLQTPVRESGFSVELRYDDFTYVLEFDERLGFLGYEFASRDPDKGSKKTEPEPWMACLFES